ncbi:MAG: FMN-binding protein [candidate division Zixibacteria bacterium]|jgi:electron transport complex protein RnfG|nr:FMN-binding protein [candidate division Zixibacteria bacterium]
MREIVKLVVVLGLICGLSAAALTFARQSLAKKIETQSDLYVRGPALQRLFDRPADQLLQNKITFNSGGGSYTIFYLTEGNEITALAVEAPGPGGYSGDVLIMIGLDLTTNKMLNIEIIQHSETPGVGSRIEKATFRKQWSGLSADTPVRMGQGGQIDAISGATYSSRAVVAGTNVIADLIQNHRDDILEAIKAHQS